MAEAPLALHLHRGTRAVQRMVEHAPSTGGLALWCHHEDARQNADQAAQSAHAESDAPPITTDGHTLFYAAGFDALPLAEQAGHVAHGVLHVALRHAQRFVQLQQRIGDADLQLFNICADAIVNSALDHLGWLRLPANAVKLDQLLAATVGERKSADAALAEWDVERLYRALDDRKPQTPQKPQDGPRSARARQLGAAAAQDLRPNEKTLSAPEEEADQIRQWSERLLRGHAGDGAQSMLRALIADLPRTRTPWEQVLRMRLARSLAQQPGLSWSRPARSYVANQGRVGKHHRMPWEPGTTATRNVAKLAVVVDVSGSIDGNLMERFAREIEAISRRLEATLLLIVGDDRVRHTASFEPGRSTLREIVFDGGGDTDFTPMLEAAAAHRPDIVVVLTDLDGPARFRPRCPVLWAVPASVPAAVAPFGRVLTLH